MLSLVSRNRYTNMSSQDSNIKENTMDALPAVKAESLRPKGPSKVVRLLTVIAYVLSVSLAAIFLSIYYIFIWKDKTFASAESIVLTTAHPYNFSIMDNEGLENFSFIHSDSNEAVEWSDTQIPDEMRRQIINNDIIELTSQSTTSTTTEENSTWLDEDFNSLQEDDGFKSSRLLKRLIYKKYPSV